MLRRSVTIITVCVLIVVAIALATYFYFQWKKAVTAPNPEEEIAKVTSVIENYMELPEGETPTIATVLDKEKLKDQAFFNKSENGDKVLIYTTAKKAILYRPSTKKVIEVAPIYFDETNLEDTPATPEEITSDITPVTTTLRVAYYDGTGVVGGTVALENKLKVERPLFQSTLITSTSRVYQGINVIDLTGTKAAEVQDVATLVGGTVTTFPEGEIRPDADVLIIVGR